MCVPYLQNAFLNGPVQHFLCALLALCLRSESSYHKEDELMYAGDSARFRAAAEHWLERSSMMRRSGPQFDSPECDVLHNLKRAITTYQSTLRKITTKMVVRKETYYIGTIAL